MLRYIDAHNHLQDDWLAPFRAEILETCEQIGVVRAVVNGTIEDDWDDVCSLARERAWILPSYGLHPWHLARRTAYWRERLREKVEPGNCAMGEIGLDRWMEGHDPDDQREVFTWQLALAAENNLPVTIHCLKAWGALAEILREHPLPARGFLLHAYGGPREMIDEFAKRGAYFSFNAYFLNPRKSQKLEMFKSIPLERLLVETDAPAMPLPRERAKYFLPPSPEGKTVNHPGNIAAAYDALAELRGMEVEKLAAQIETNFQHLFGP